jgi:transcriptional regulator with XRE-family HTH domain
VSTTTGTDARTPLRRVREARGLRLEDLAAASGVSIRALFDAERGRGRPHASSKKLIAQALELDPGDLWPYEGEAA